MAQGLFTLRQVNQAIRQGAWSAFNPPQWVEYLCVAGGGGGGGYSGGGAGGLLTGIVTVTTGTSYTVTIGAGGATGQNGSNGQNSVFGNITANSGGGGKAAISGLDGGSGGGAGYDTSKGGQGVAGQGNAGGNTSSSASPYPGAGGGGAGTVGLNSGTGIGGNGGAGIASSINGNVTTYAGGGGGGVYTGGTAGVGGVGGGGVGGVAGTGATAGTVNRGGGGGGGGIGDTTGGGAGSSGIVIVRYPGSVQFYTGGTVWVANGFVVHYFTASGTLAPTTPTTLPSPATIGQAYGGGYYAGMISTSGNGIPTHYLVVADVTVGQSLKTYGPQGTTTGYTSVIAGPTNSAGLAALGPTYEAATFCEGLNTGGYTDWYMPALNELAVLYYFLKPGTPDTNQTAAGSNANAVYPQPLNTNYTTSLPAQTVATSFRTGASSQEFGLTQYWTSTETTSNEALRTNFYNGNPLYANKNVTDTYVRAVRRVAI